MKETKKWILQYIYEIDIISFIILIEMKTISDNIVYITMFICFILKKYVI